LFLNLAAYLANVAEKVITEDGGAMLRKRVAELEENSQLRVTTAMLQ
jgi:hypothetical protein